MDKESVSIFAEPMWAIVELMGRNVIAGLIQSVAAAGTELLRVDVPPVDGVEGFTKFFGGSAIYAITPSDEESVGYVVESTKLRAISEWVVPTRVLRAPIITNIDVHQDDYVDEDDVPF